MKEQRIFYNLYGLTLIRSKKVISEFQKVFSTLNGAEKIRAVWDLFPIYGNSHANELIPYAQQTLALAKQDGDAIEVMKNLRLNGTLYFRTGSFKKALIYYEELKQTAHEHNNEEMLCLAYTNIGSVYTQKKSYVKALDHFHLALKHNDIVEDKIYNSLGVIYLNLNDYENAIKYFKKYGAHKKKINDQQGLSRYHCNLGSVYVEKGYLEKAQDHFFQAEKLCKKDEETFIYNAILHNIATVFQKKGKLEEAEKFSRQVLRNAKRIKDAFMEAETSVQLAEILFLQNKQEETIEFAMHAKEIALKKEFNKCLLKAYDLLARAYYNKGMLKTAWEYGQKQNKGLKQELQQLNEELNDANLDAKNQIIEQLEDKNTLIKSQNTDLREFAYIVAHDLKTPLRIIVSFADLILRQNAGDINPASTEFLEYIREASHKLHFKLEDLLYFVTLDKNKANYRRINPNELIKELIKQFEDEIAESKMNIQVDELPQIYGSEEQIRQYFYHLIDNAIKFRRDDKPEVKIFADKIEDKIQIAFKDNGIGIESAFQKKVFQLFQQLDQQNRKGNGFGLSICRKIAELHGGSMSLKSEPKLGSTFYLHLPTEN